MIHKFKLNGYNIVLDVNSGAVHCVDDIVYETLDYYGGNGSGFDEAGSFLEKKYDRASVKEAFLEIKTLEGAGLLFSGEHEEGLADNNFKNRNPVVKALCLHVAHDCNLKCKYCFADEGEYNGHRSFMNAEVGERAIDFLIANSAGRTNLEIDFFGGEPLMNFDVVKHIVSYAREREKQADKNFRFTITTNGLLLDIEKEEYINQNMQNVVLSIDGRREVNDKIRKNAAGVGVYDKIMPAFQRIAKNRNQTGYYVRGTFTAENLDFSNDVLHLAKCGFKQISVEPVVASEKEDYALKEEHLPELYNQYESLAKIMADNFNTENDINYCHYMLDLD